MDYSSGSIREQPSKGPFGLRLDAWRGRGQGQGKYTNPVTALMLQELEDLAVTEEDVPVSQQPICLHACRYICLPPYLYVFQSGIL